MDHLSQRPLFSEQSSTLGFDLSAGNIWIYPENYPVREYQFSIVKNALFRNTLVCLPTGLGKTFIAAVVMYNFWRWYPKGKVVFLAPTKPLVTQQINACHEIMGIPNEETIELTGTTNQKLRETAWTNHRVIFATPQTFHKDLEKNIFPMNLVKCLVIDEAHKALGKHSYCESVRLLSEQNSYFRIVALSATPGDKISKVHEVITNLRIAKLELRDDTSPDITPYINERRLDIILVRLSDELARFKERYITVMDPHVRVLIRNNIRLGDTNNISKGRIFYLLRDFQSKPNKTGNYGQIMKTLNILQTMYHAYDLMIRHGLRAFLHFYENHSDKFWMGQEVNLHELLDEIKNYLGPFPVIEPLPDGSIPDVPNNLMFGHNKFYKLKEVLERHFKAFRDKNEETRAIVFIEYRDIVNEVYVLLLKCRPLIRPQMFVGQAGQKQKKQIEALENFRNNKVNVLISTSVGEEGLDVGEVDLIVCFDISQSSPIRLVQRMGRTGRKRNGHIIALVTDGKEHESLKATLIKKDNLNSKVLHSKDIVSALNSESPRMVPNELNPECRKMHMKVQSKTSTVKGVMKKAIQRTRKKNIETKSTEHESSTKNPGQSLIQNFFKPSKSGEKSVDINRCFLSQTQQSASIKDINLYFNDTESEEFLTLCAMRKSRDDFHILNFKINERYVPTCDSNSLGFLRDLVLPNLDILNCVKSIPKAEVTIEKMSNQDIPINQMPEETFISDCFDRRNRYSNASVKVNEASIERSFVDLLYDSSTPENSDDSQANESTSKVFEITGQFDDLLVETTDESDVESHQEVCTKVLSNANNSALENKENKFNFSQLLGGTSLDSITSQDLLRKSFGNKEAVNEENSFRKPNSLNASYVSLTSNCSGLTITQALEEIRRINANKSISNNSFKVEDIPASTIIERSSNETITEHNKSRVSNTEKTVTQKKNILYEIPESFEDYEIMEQNKPSVSKAEETATQKKNRLNKILESDEDLFTNEIMGLSFLNDNKIHNSGENEGNKNFKKIDNEKALPTQNRKNTQVNSSKANTILEKENSILAYNVISDDDWESDFEAPVSEISNTKYFQNNESLKTKNITDSIDTKNKVPSKEKSMVTNIKISEPTKKFSLFNWNKSAVLQDSQKKNNTLNSSNKSFAKENSNDWDKILLPQDSREKSSTSNLNSSFSKAKIDDVRDGEVFKKPFVRTPGPFSLKRINANAPSTSSGSINKGTSPKSPNSDKNMYYNKNLHSTKNTNPNMNTDFNKKSDLNPRISGKREAHGSILNSSFEESPVRKRKSEKKRRRNCNFIDNEAGVSSDENQTSEGSSGEDNDLEGFVSYTQNATDEVDMRAHYLNSVKSPIRRPGAFLIRKPVHVEENVFSQPASQLNDTYMHDSFCVREDECEYDEEESENELEITYEKLREPTGNRNRNRKRTRSPEFKNNKRKKKKRRIQNLKNSSSSEDETEHIRRQIQEESFLLKRAN